MDLQRPTSAPSMRSRDEMLTAFLASDEGYDGLFISGVRTTGIFCRPSCGARKPLAENVVFFSDSAAALLAGYRACKRCTPLAAGPGDPAWLDPLLAEIEAVPDERIGDAALRERGIDPATARRVFQRRYGMTFHAYQRGRRLARAFAGLRAGERVDAVAYDNGFESTSGFRDAFSRLFGAPPAGAARQAGLLHVRWLETPLGAMLAAATDTGICLLEFSERRALEAQVDGIHQALGLPAVPGTNAHLDRLAQQIGAYFRGELTSFDVPLVTPGSAFQQTVWQALQQIPYGQTRSYAQLAALTGRPGGSQAVGRANGSNRIAIVIPCHRVIGADGQLSGYGGGLWRKHHLLELERRNLQA